MFLLVAFLTDFTSQGKSGGITQPFQSFEWIVIHGGSNQATLQETAQCDNAPNLVEVRVLNEYYLEI